MIIDHKKKQRQRSSIDTAFLNFSMCFKIQCVLNLRTKMRCGIDVNRVHSFLSRLVVPLEMMVTLTTSNPATFVDSFPSLDATQALVK